VRPFSRPARKGGQTRRPVPTPRSRPLRNPMRLSGHLGTH
jgi:hypothetical protein